MCVCAFGDVPVFVDEGVEGHSIAPARGEIVNVDIGVAVEDGRDQRPQSKMSNTPV